MLRLTGRQLQRRAALKALVLVSALHLATQNAQGQSLLSASAPISVDVSVPAEPAAAVQPIASQLHNAIAITSFLIKLSSAASLPAPLSIVQIGDSHTAGDTLTNGWRQRWQAEFGAGGRGAMPVGKPYQGYFTRGVTAHQSADWTATSIFGRQYLPGGPALGLSGFVQSAQHAGASLQLTADIQSFMFDRFSLCGLTGPDKGTVRIKMGGVAQDYGFASDRAGATCFDVDTPKQVGEVSVTSLNDRPINLTSWEVRHRTGGGVILSNLGVVGSRFLHFTRNDDTVLALELRHAHPDLLVIAFGTNEGFDSSLNIDDAEAMMRRQIVRIRRLLGYTVPIMLIGPPDAQSDRPAVALPSNDATVACGHGWYVPGNLLRIRRMQMRLAQDMDLAFWDWQQAMGGTCSSSKWVSQGLQRNDHVHFTTEGGHLLGKALTVDLDHAHANMAR